MDTYYTVEEKYLQAVDEFSFGETPKALHLLNEIINNDSLYARAHYLLGKIYYYDIQDYQTAGYHFKTCMELEPAFPDIYVHYLHLVVFLSMEKQVNSIVAKAINTPGVNLASVYNLLGMFCEKNKSWVKASVAYQNAMVEVMDKEQKDNIEENITRLKAKMEQGKAYQYTLTE